MFSSVFLPIKELLNVTLVQKYRNTNDPSLASGLFLIKANISYFCLSPHYQLLSYTTGFR